MLGLKKIKNYITGPRLRYQPLISVVIFKDNLIHNLNEYKSKYPGLLFAPVLKSNAYGHGLVEIARVLDKENVPFFMVDSFYEALVLRRAGISSKILILGFATEEQVYKNSLKDCSFGIISLSFLKKIAKNLKKKTSFHLKIDTGMNRQGILLNEVSEAIALVKSNKNIVLEGACSHFADSENKDVTSAEKQILLWNSVSEIFEKEFPSIKYFHLANTAGVYFSGKARNNVARLGIGLYGINTSPFGGLNLKPVLELRSLISSVKNIGPGSKVGYGGTFESKKEMKIATVPAGYNEGVDRRLSNIGYMEVKGKICPIIGRVSMNMSSIDVSEVVGIEEGEPVVIYSKEGKNKNSVENSAKIGGCLEREIMVHIPGHLHREIV